MELLRPIVRFGNSAGVLLPREWLNGKARVELVEKPADVRKEIFEILDEYLSDIIGIAIAGSYARSEENSDSDVDVLVITKSINKKINSGKYEIILISEDNLRKDLDRNILPLLPMLKEAKPIMNNSVIEKYKNISLSKKNLSFHFNTSVSAMNIVKSELALTREKDGDFLSDRSAYSLILRLRELYIVDCLLQNEKWSTKGFLHLIRKVSGSLKAYEGYLSVKRDKKSKVSYLTVKEAENIYLYILEGINRQKKSWAKTRK